MEVVVPVELEAVILVELEADSQKVMMQVRFQPGRLFYALVSG